MPAVGLSVCLQRSAKAGADRLVASCVRWPGECDFELPAKVEQIYLIINKTTENRKWNTARRGRPGAKECKTY